MARILVARRSILLLDEPSAHLDRETEQLLGRLITRVADERLVVVVTHSEEIAQLSDLIVELASRDVAVAAPRAVVPRSLTEPSTLEDVAATFSDDADERAPGGRARAAGAIALGVLASLSGVALTATAGWLIVKASEHPPVLTLMVAIVGVRTFGLARPCLRYAERLMSHDVALRRLATAREQLFAALVPLTPGRLGHRRGELLDQLVEDAEAEVDRRLRVWLPLATIGGTGVLVVGFVAAAWPGLAGPSAALVFGAGAVGLLLWFRTRTCSATIADARRVLADQVTRLIEVRAELRWWDASDRVVEEVTRSGRRLERLTRHERGRESLTGSAIITVVGCATAASLLLVADAVATNGLEPAWAGLLVLVPLALGELVQGLPDVAVARGPHPPCPSSARRDHQPIAPGHGPGPAPRLGGGGTRAQRRGARSRVGRARRGASRERVVAGRSAGRRFGPVRIREVHLGRHAWSGTSIRTTARSVSAACRCVLLRSPTYADGSCSSMTDLTCSPPRCATTCGSGGRGRPTPPSSSSSTHWDLPAGSTISPTGSTRCSARATARCREAS